MIIIAAFVCFKSTALKSYRLKLTHTVVSSQAEKRSLLSIQF